MSRLRQLVVGTILVASIFIFAAIYELLVPHILYFCQSDTLKTPSYPFWAVLVLLSIVPLMVYSRKLLRTQPKKSRAAIVYLVLLSSFACVVSTGAIYTVNYRLFCSF